MAMTPAVGLGALALALVAALSACQGSSTPTGDPSTSATSEPTSPSPDPTSPSPTSTSPSDEASAQAIALVPNYLKTIDDLFSAPTLSPNRLHDVSVGREFRIEVATLLSFRRKGYRQSGSSQLVKATVGAVSLTNHPNASPPRVPTIAVRACVDVSAVQVTDATGKSIVPVGRPNYLVEQLLLTNHQYPDPSGWRVSHAPNKQAASCDG
jgi:hypothetical protein